MITINVNTKALDMALQDMEKRMSNLTPVMEEIGEIIVSSAQENFERQGRYSSPGSWKGGSNKWKPLKPATIKQRMRKGYWPGKTLQQRGRLKSSIGYRAGKNSVEIGTNLAYAAIHQFGGRAGRNLTAEIPARPYLVVQEEDLEEIREIITDYILNQ
ncbi:phage virion morphogenesis protein [Desulfovulcanus sp.]